MNTGICEYFERQFFVFTLLKTSVFMYAAHVSSSVIAMQKEH